MKILFLGNSATYVHEIPQTLAKLAKKLGHEVEIGQITPGGCELAKHADIMCEHGRFVNDEINKGYDIVKYHSHLLQPTILQTECQGFLFSLN